MALTIVIKGKDPDADRALTFDATRIVIGRSKSCDLWLPDPSVAKRHASIRREGGKSLIVDEGSANGLVVDRVTLPAHAPTAIETGSLFRIGRFWLEVRQAAGVASPPSEIRRVALEVVKMQLESEGEPSVATLQVVGDDGATGARLELSDVARDYIVGRSREADLSLADELVSRRHVALTFRGNGWSVRDLGSKRGTQIQAIGDDDEVASEAPLTDEPRALKSGELLRVGNTRLRLVDPVVEAFEEALAAPELKLRASEFRGPPAEVDDRRRGRLPEPGARSFPRGLAPDEADDVEEEGEDDAGEGEVRTRTRSAEGFNGADLLVALIALALIVASALGLVWVLR